MLMKQAIILKHVPFEGPGIISTWLTSNNYVASVVNMFDNPSLPAVADVDFLIVMGGPMGVNDTSKYIWLETELLFIKECIAYNVPVIGICLGAQLIAKALGGNIYANESKEIGWYPVQFNNREIPEKLRSASIETAVFHWHGDTFTLPAGAKCLGSTSLTTNQMFLYKNYVLGIQFHAEMRPGDIETLVGACADELNENDQSVMKPGQILNYKADLKSMHQFIFEWLNFITS